MGRRGGRTRRSWRVGSRKAADYIIMARIQDQALTSLITRFPELVGMSSGEARELHVTLFGPFRSSVHGDALLTRIEEVACRPNHLSCTTGDLARLKGMRGGAIALILAPDQELTKFYQRLVSVLPLVSLRCTWIDTPPGHRIFHVSLRFNIPFREFDSFWKRTVEIPPSNEYKLEKGKESVTSLRTYLKSCDSPIGIFRIAIMRRGSLWKEYDLPQKIWLSRKESADPRGWERTYHQFRVREGLELHGNARGVSPQQFLISDLHLGHRNIIHYCRRPFFSSREMDEVLIGNWNCRVSPGDEVFYLGDLCHGRNAPPAAEYLSQMNGRIHIIAGNHDEAIPGAVTSLTLRHGEREFLLVHDPATAAANFPGWIIHGHHHNNHMGTYPFINAESRTINVSAELLDYIPVSIAELCTILQQVHPGEKIGTLKEARARTGPPAH